MELQHTEQKTEKKVEKKSFIKSFLNIISNILLVALSVFIIYMLVFMFKGMKGNETPTILNHQIYVVRSNSMNPTFKTGSLLVVKLVNTGDIQINDIITYRRPNDSIATTHRVVDIIEDDGRAFVTRGDANNVDDPVLTAIPLLGYLIGFVRTKQGLLVVIIIPALLIILSQIIHLIKQENKKEKKPTIEELQDKVNKLLNQDQNQEQEQGDR
jgi:signal peptidase